MSPNHARAARLRERLEERLSRTPPEHAYPVSEWQIVERAFQPEYLPALESVFAVANGYLGLRGTPEEGAPSHEAGAVLNGLHETWPIVYPEDAYGLARVGPAVDLADVHGNTADGIHIASCGGTWLALVAGFGGLREDDGEVCFSPRLPAEWDRLRFRVQVRGQVVEVDMTHKETTYRLVEDTGLMVHHFDEPLRLLPEAPVSCRERAELRRAA